ncbi:hypothetical protein GLAREA_07969 [Glarea lozoyensis ATCC 20868]|uniref:Transmembrane protein n=1 Tax=Glarea lozoyensis (strain ATCC 20868 / MF5171) TaxID=1116229 RepID=S3CFU1_GLAL2|nr:uncharacterized protein GLAREA_07969 [Glarea lozoyensis ATCC 20868]EPE24119.1 hypothetical protein GLAREA_07969 [Glarea lozoyensis ATCC 20868]
MVQRGVFFTARAVEAVSVKLGFGKFEVGDHWQCRACTHGEDDLCDDCIDSWVGELTHLNYSDDYERRLNVTAGITMMIMGLAAILGNASMNMWEEGDVVAAVSNLLKAVVPSILLHRGPWTFYYNLFLVVVWLSTVVVFWGSMLVAMFLMCMNPMSPRHRKHMTPSAWVGMVVFVTLYAVVLIADGISIPDQILVIWPVIMGVAACLTPFAMRAAEADLVLDKLDSEEKQS